MSSQNYESGKLNSILESLFKKKISGILSLKTKVSHWHVQRSCVLMVRDGALVYGNANISKIPNNKEVCQTLGEKLKPNLINAALSVAIEKSDNPSSTRELMELLTKMKVFSWNEAEALVTKKIIVILEQFLPNPGKAKWQSSNNFDLDYGEDRHGLSWSNIKLEINQRRHKWNQYAPTIPSMDAIPVVSLEQLEKIGDRNVIKHLKSSVDGKNTLLDIADKIEKDPLKVAKSYINWANNGWVDFATEPQTKLNRVVKNVAQKVQSTPNQTKTPGKVAPEPTNLSAQEKLPIVLSVDDSAIIQTSIKRALQQQYQVLLANTAADAMTMLNMHSVQLLLLDLTMPDIDGLEFCKIVRQIDKFRDLPIVMVTARDGFINKMKGQIAGSSKYFTTPFKPDQLREIVAEYIK
ncbi:MAG: response regulator [Pleurocapsa sp.]